MPLMHVMVVYTMSMMNLLTFAKARPAQMIFITTSNCTCGSLERMRAGDRKQGIYKACAGMWHCVRTILTTFYHMNHYHYHITPNLRHHGHVCVALI
jgi:hypothetical protein